MAKLTFKKWEEPDLLGTLGEEGVADLEQVYDVDLTDGAISAEVSATAEASLSDIEAILASNKVQDDIPLIIIAPAFSAEALDKAREFEDVLLCEREADGTLKPFIPA